MNTVLSTSIKRFVRKLQRVTLVCGGIAFLMSVIFEVGTSEFILLGSFVAALNISLYGLMAVYSVKGGWRGKVLSFTLFFLKLGALMWLFVIIAERGSSSLLSFIFGFLAILPASLIYREPEA
ncbi:MAG: hypothetical protein D6808_06140 [Candidatus Dadabacteria bacterium]|nr:MAG: hypothetical protein D6808_06140 [Candidatus Dadabacteria bacterium]